VQVAFNQSPELPQSMTPREALYRIRHVPAARATTPNLGTLNCCHQMLPFCFIADHASSSCIVQLTCPVIETELSSFHLYLVASL
jgi:hypothetical protein